MKRLRWLSIHCIAGGAAGKAAAARCAPRRQWWNACAVAL